MINTADGERIPGEGRSGSSTGNMPSSLLSLVAGIDPFTGTITMAIANPGHAIPPISAVTSNMAPTVRIPNGQNRIFIPAGRRDRRPSSRRSRVGLPRERAEREPDSEAEQVVLGNRK